MSSKQNPKPRPSETINHYFPKLKRNAEEISVEKTLAKRLRDESQLLKDLDSAKELSNIQSDHTECDKKVMELERQVVDLTNKNREILNDCKRLKKMFDEATKINLQKDMKINKMISKGGENSKKGERLMFYKYKSDFTDSELTVLRSIRFLNKDDSTFIATCLRILYKEDLKVLKHRTAEMPFDGKTPITPKKKDLIKNIYQERLAYVSPDEYSFRYNKFNIHLKNAIHNTIHSKLIE